MHLIQPIININGQRAEVHVADRLRAREIVGDLFEALARLRPHGRDYPGAPERYNTDLAEHTRRLMALNELEEALFNESLALHREKAA